MGLLFRLLAQKVRCVSDQFCYHIHFGGVVVTTDLAMPIYQHHPRAVDRNPLSIAAVGYRKFEAVVRDFVNSSLGAGQKIPAAGLGL